MCTAQFRLATYSKKLPPKKRSLQIYSKFAVAKFGACSQYYQKCLAASALEWPDCNHQNITVTCCPLIQAKNAVKIATWAFLFSAVTLLSLSLLVGSSEICCILLHINPFTRLLLLCWLLKIPGSAQTNYVPDTAVSKPSSDIQSSAQEQRGETVLQNSAPACSTCFNLR